MAEDNEHIENKGNFSISSDIEPSNPLVIDADYSVVNDPIVTPTKSPQNKPAEPAAPAAEASTPVPRLTVPQGNVADLLEHQVAICAGLIGNVAEFIAGDARPENCFPFMDRIARLMSSSAKAGRAIGQLRGIASETRQTHVKEKNREREGASI